MKPDGAPVRQDDVSGATATEQLSGVRQLRESPAGGSLSTAGPAPVGGPGPSALLAHAAGLLDAAGLRWVLLRDSIPGISTSEDVDLLVDPAGARELDPLLAGAGFRRLPSAGAGTHRFYLGYDERADDWVTLDVVTEAAFGRRLELATAAADDLLRRARRVDGLPVLAPDDALWHRLLHYLVDKPAIPPGGAGALHELAQHAQVGGPLGSLVDELAPAGRSADALLDMLRLGQTDAVQALAAPLRATWVARAKWRTQARAATSLLARAHLLPSASAPGIGRTIAIIGPDGAGKTTLAESLARSIPLPTRVVYMGVWREYRWDRWLRLVPGARLAVRTARLAVRSVEAEYHRGRGRLVLLDRFTLDAALPAPELDWRGRLTATLVRKLARDPDVLLLLDAPAEVMYARKREQGLRVLDRDRRSYRRLIAGHPAATMIDATLPPDLVRAAAHRALWPALVARPT